jgi:hypothetical protein
MLALHVLLPPVLLSLVRKPCDYFAFNAWLASLPDYLVSDGAPIGVKAGKLWNLALFWFSASSPYGTEWGFAVDTGDLARMIVASLLVAAYFALWRCRRGLVGRAPAQIPGRLHDVARDVGTGPRALQALVPPSVAPLDVRLSAAPDATPRDVGMAAPGARLDGLAPRHVASSGTGSGFVGGLASVLGLTTGPCSVMGCGAPVMPVVGLAFAGLSSTTVALLASLATWSAFVVLAGLTLAVAWLGWLVGADRA